MSLRRFFRRRRDDLELASEIESYLSEEAAAQESAHDLSPEEAREAALRKFGNPALIREDVYRRNSFGLFENVKGDLHHALRGLVRAPGFAVIAIVTLALGIGLNSAMFSVIYGVLLRPLPYPDAARIVHLVRVDGGSGDATIPEYQFWKQHSTSLEFLTAERGTEEQEMLADTDREWITTLTVGTDFLRTLGIAPALGRGFNTAETLPGSQPAIVLTDALWRRRFRADPGILGRSVRLAQANYVVVGVLPRNFWYPQACDALIPLRPSGNLGDLGANTGLIGRLRDGVPLDRARSQMKLLSDAFRKFSGQPAQYLGLTIVPYRDWLVGDVRTNVLLLFAATGVVLLIALANLAVLLVTRFQSRRKELAVRLALGCGRARLLLQHLVENLLLVGLGSAAGLALSFALVKALIASVPFHLPTSMPIHLGSPVVGFAIALGIGVASAFTLIPLLTAQSVDVNEALKSGGRASAGIVRSRGRSVLIITEVALSTMLLISAGLLIQSLYRLTSQHLGFDPHRIITFETPFAPARANDAAERALYIRNMLDRMRAVPGVADVAASNVIPLVGWGNLPAEREGHDEQSIGGMEVRTVAGDYFNTLHVPVLRGRHFSRRDTTTSPAVALINETLARAWYASTNPLGDHVVIGRYQGHDYLKDAPREIVGVAADTKIALKDQPRPTIFVPLAQAGSLSTSGVTWIVRFSNASASAEDLRRAAASVDPTQRTRRFQSMEQIVASSSADARFNALLFLIFGTGALVLAAIGVYGLVSFLVARRRNEIGTRMAVGAIPRDILRLFLRQGMVLTMIGICAGWIASYALAHLIAGLLFGVAPHDVVSFVIPPLVLFAAALLAIFIPARRAAAVDPVVALHYE